MDKKAVIFFSFVSIVFGQISMSDINKLSNAQLDAIKQELQSQSTNSVTEDNISIQPTEIPSVEIQSQPSISDSDYIPLGKIIYLKACKGLQPKSKEASMIFFGI